MSGAPARTFKVVMSERCYRFKPDALPSHAPAKPGVYEFVTFKPDGGPEVLYVGTAIAGSVFKSLSEHLMGQARPTAEELFAAAKDVYFDYVAHADIDSPEDLRDIAAFLIEKHKPRFNGSPDYSGRYAAVSVSEA